MLRSLASTIATDDGYDDLLGELQHNLAGLADVEMRHEVEREQIEAWPGSIADKEHLSSECERRYHLKREPYLHRLNELQRQARMRILAGL
jgi:hypothetical protein